MHFESANTEANRHAELAKYEVGQIYRALEELETPIVLLKGAAYTVSDLPVSEGRVFNDTDIMVHTSQIPLVENALQYAGWVVPKSYNTKHARFDKSMRELPPMVHKKRKTVIDVHHTILPSSEHQETGTVKTLKAAVGVGGYEYLTVLCPEDMVLHCAVHLFHDGDFGHGLRDLTDLDQIMRACSFAAL